MQLCDQLTANPVSAPGTDSMCLDPVWNAWRGEPAMPPIYHMADCLPMGGRIRGATWDATVPLEPFRDLERNWARFFVDAYSDQDHTSCPS